jgi:hypothetical protein
LAFSLTDSIPFLADALVEEVWAPGVRGQSRKLAAMKRLLVIVFLVGACTGSTAAPAASTSDVLPTAAALAPTPTPVATPTAVPTPSPTPDPEAVRKVAGAAYLATVKVSNKAGDDLAKQYKNRTSFLSWKHWCSKAAKITRTEMLALKAITYPADTAADAKALIRFDAAEEANLRSCAKAKSWAGLAGDIKLFDKAGNKGHEAANLVRLNLNLPPVPG